jgi:hypothetical protein
MPSYLDLKSYIEYLCVNHNDVRHRDDEPHFFMIGLDEILTRIRSSVNFPAVFLSDYDYSFADNKSDNVLKNRSFALVFIDHCQDADDYDSLAGIYDHMEKIADDFLNRMYNDKNDRRHSFLKDLDLNGINAVQFQAPDNNFGVWIPVVAPSVHDISVDNDIWSDL